jgi:PQQ-dependent dehydrogenase (methanol/ethanol family)
MTDLSNDKAVQAVKNTKVQKKDEFFVVDSPLNEPVTETHAADMIPEKNVTQEMLTGSGSNADAWLMYGGGYKQQRHTTADVITPENVGDLSLDWLFQTGTGSGELEGSPVIVPGDPPVMYQTNGPNHVKALNARNGDVFWSYTYSNPNNIRPCCGLNNRGVAVYQDKVYMTTLDANLVALDRYTGEQQWQYNSAEPSEGYANTEAPVVYNDMVIMGSGGGEFGVRGYVDAVDPESGEQMWRRWTVPEDQWIGESWQNGCSTVWMTPSIDTDSDTIYAPTGNPGPDVWAGVRPGLNPYSNGTLALDANSGEPQWHYNESPHDWWDYDSPSPPVLFDAEVNGEERRLTMSAGKVGWVFTMDAGNGQLVERSEPFAQMLNTFDLPPAELEDSPWIMPSADGGSEWNPASYDPNSQTVFVKAMNYPSKFQWDREEYETGRLYLGGGFTIAPEMDDVEYPPEEEWNRNLGVITALDPISGEVKWQDWYDEFTMGGSMTTATGLVFAGNGSGEFIAYDVESGERLWQFNLGASINASPVSWYDPGTEKQYVAIQAGGGGLRSHKTGDAVAVFSMEA